MNPAPHRPIVIAERSPNDMRVITQRIRATAQHEPVVGFPDAQGVIDYLEQALRLPARIPLPRLLFTDILLPRIDGFSLISWIRRQPALDELQIHVISAAIDPDFPRRARELGAAGFLSKFPSTEAVAELIETANHSVASPTAR